jgi:hypothetical protein
MASKVRFRTEVVRVTMAAQSALKSPIARKLGIRFDRPTIYQLDLFEVKVDKIIHDLFERHFRGDWGDVGKVEFEDCNCQDNGEIDIELNEKALQNGWKVFSRFDVGGKELWVVTEGDRSRTTIMTPNEYFDSPPLDCDSN